MTQMVCRAESGPPVLFNPKDGYREPPDKTQLRYVVPPMNDLWHFWGDDVKNCGGDQDPVTGHLYSGASFETIAKL